MTTHTATVSTPMAGRYMRQLCSHWSHKFAVAADAQSGSIDFGDGKSCTMSADDHLLHVSVTAPGAEIERMQGVVADHINRFAHKESGLRFDWRA